MCNPADALESAGDKAANVTSSAAAPVEHTLDATVAPVGDNKLVQDIFQAVVMYTLGQGAGAAAAGEGAGLGSTPNADVAGSEYGAAESTGSAGAGVSGNGDAVMPPGEDAPVTTTDSSSGATGATKTGGSDILGTIKTLAPTIAAGAAITSALVSADAAQKQADAAKQNAAALSNTSIAPPATPQAAIDPDLTAIRKKNALLFGLDSPAGTDLTKGTADTGNLGRITLLGGTSKLA